MPKCKISKLFKMRMYYLLTISFPQKNNWQLSRKRKIRFLKPKYKPNIKIKSENQLVHIFDATFVWLIFMILVLLFYLPGCQVDKTCN